MRLWATAVEPINKSKSSYADIGVKQITFHHKSTNVLVLPVVRPSYISLISSSAVMPSSFQAPDKDFIADEKLFFLSVVGTLNIRIIR